MPVDTRDKRFSMMSMGRPWVPTLPVPDGGFTTAGDRAQLEFRYSGIGAAPPPPVTEVERVKPPASFHARRFVAYIPRSFKRET